MLSELLLSGTKAYFVYMMSSGPAYCLSDLSPPASFNWFGDLGFFWPAEVLIRSVLAEPVGARIGNIVSSFWIGRAPSITWLPLGPHVVAEGAGPLWTILPSVAGACPVPLFRHASGCDTHPRASGLFCPRCCSEPESPRAGLFMEPPPWLSRGGRALRRVLPGAAPLLL
jgi:hypothetical protein